MYFTPTMYASLDSIIEDYTDEASDLLENALGPLHSYAGKASAFIKWVLARGYVLSGGYYTGEIRQWAEALGVSESDIIAANVSYELAQAGQFLSTKFPSIGCTSVVLDNPSLGLVHVRNLDWDLDGMGTTTVVRLLERADGEAVAVTNPGFVGALSGMVPGDFSVSMNWVPPTSRPRFAFGPAFLLRWVLENAKDFDDAVAYLSGTPLSSSVLFTVCGTDNACVIERSCKESDIRWYDGEPLAVTNHYMSEMFEEHNSEDEFVEYSAERHAEAVRAARKFKGRKLEGLFKILSGPECLNDITVQQMVFAPAEADYSVRSYGI